MEKTLELLRVDDDIIPDWLIPFAEEDGGNLFCFSVRESDFGAIYYYDHELSRCFSSGDTSKKRSVCEQFAHSKLESEYGEDPEEHIIWLAESITAFINALTENEDDEDDSEDDEDEE